MLPETEAAKGELERLPIPMRTPIPLVSLALILTSATLTGFAFRECLEARRYAADAAFYRKQVALLESESERLRGLVAENAKVKQDAIQARQRAEIERATSRIRGLPFKQPVVYATLTREGIKKVLLQKLSEQLGESEFERARLGFVALGLIPADYPLKERYVDLLGEQVAAFYDQHERRLFMFEDASLDSPQNRVILSHELTHALQDQNFGLEKLPLESKENDDRALAASALVEGDATLEMNVYAVENLSLKIFTDGIAGVFTQNLEQLQTAPRILRESLLFPYIAGQRFCTAMQSGDGSFAGVSAVFARPPSSTAQILHPEKYLAHEEPVPVSWADTAVLGEKAASDNVLGELGTRILLADWVDEPTADRVSAGWRGDRYLVFDHGKALVWRTVWNSQAAEEQFSKAEQQALAKRYQSAPLPSAFGIAPGGRLEFKTPGRDVRLVFLDGNSVALIDAPDSRWAAALEEKFAKPAKDAEPSR